MANYRRDFESLCLPGTVTVLAASKMGKTTFAESLVSSALKQYGMSKYEPTVSSDIVDAAARTWLAPQVVTAAMEQGLFTDEELQQWAASALAALGVESEVKLKHQVAFIPDISYNTLAARWKLLDAAQLNVVDCDAYCELADVTESSVHLALHRGSIDVAKRLLLPIEHGLDGCDKMLAITGHDGGVFVSIVDYDAATMIQLSGSDVNRWLDAIDAADMLTAAPWVAVRPHTEGAFAPGGTESSAFALRIASESEEAFEDVEDAFAPGMQAAREELVQTVMFSNGVVSYTRMGLQDFTEGSAGSAAAAEIVKAVLAGQHSTKADSVTYDAVVQSAPLAAYRLMIEYGVMSAITARDLSKGVALGKLLRQLALRIGFSNAPVLIETEDKATEFYGAIARLANPEESVIALQVKTPNAVLSGSVEASLATAAIGAILINPVIHFSVLDTTVNFELAIRTTTRKGGLDSAQLNIMQHISGVARRAGACVIMETRDDFFGNAATTGDAGVLGARDTLGANSHIAIHIMPNEEDSDSRDFWVRVKGYGEFEDEEFEMEGVTLNDYPTNLIRKVGMAPSIRDRLIAGVEWVYSRLRELI